MSVRPDDQPGMRSLIGGGLAAGIGIMLLIFIPSPPPGSPVNAHPIGWAFIIVGVFGMVVGGLARLSLK